MARFGTALEFGDYFGLRVIHPSLKLRSDTIDLMSVPSALESDGDVEFRELVTVRRYRDLSEAIIARGVMESAGIFCFLKDENMVRLDWQISNMIGGIRLQVAAADVEAAEAVLAQPIPDIIEVTDQSDFQQPVCPRCGSTDISYERSGRKSALAFLYLFSLPIPRREASWTCHRCDLHWQDTEESSGNDN